MRWILIAGAISVLASCARTELATWNSVMDVTIEIDGERFEGKGTVEVFARWDNAPLAPGAFVSVDHVGEAVEIDVGKHGLIFALWRTHQCEDDRRAAFLHGLKFPQGRYETEKKKHRRQAKRTLAAFVNSKFQFELSEAAFPILIWFGDPNDPLTAELVTPKTIKSVFGDQAKIVSVKVGVTDAHRTPLTIVQSLPWTDAAQVNALYGSEFSAELPSCLTRRDFLVQ